MLTIKFTATFGPQGSPVVATGTINIDYATDSLLFIRDRVARKINQAVFELSISL